MNCKRSLYAAAILAAAFAMPGVGYSQTPSIAPIILPATPAPVAPRISEGVVLTVNDALISTLDLREQMTWLAITGGAAAAQNRARLQQQALDELIDEHLKYQELKRRLAMSSATEAEFFTSDERVDAFLASLAKQNNLTLKEFLARLAEDGVSTKRLRQHYRVNMTWDAYFQGYYGRRVRISPEQIKAVQDQIAAAAASPRYLLGEIFVDAARAGSVQAAVSVANQYLTQIQQGARFETLALQFSAKPTAAGGGDAGWISASDLPAPVAEALAQLRPGQITRPIAVENGAYLYLLREKSAVGGAPIVTLKQAAVLLPADATPDAAAAAQRQLLALKAKAPTCATLTALASGMPGVDVGDLGETELADLSATFRGAVENLQIDQVSEPVRTNIGLHLIAVCGRRAAGTEVPKVEDIENQLFSEQMEMRQRVELRNLRAAATISQPQ